MWTKQDQQKIIQNFKKDKDLYKFLEIVSLIHEEVADDFKRQKTLTLKEDLEFIQILMDVLKPKINKEVLKQKPKFLKSSLSFDTNIFYTLEGLYLGLNSYLNNKPKEDEIEKTSEKDIKNLLEDSYRILLKSKQEDLKLCKQNFSKAAAFILCGVPVNDYLASQISYKDDNRILLWTESIMQIIEHSKDYPITTPSDLQISINAIWKNLKKYEVDEDLVLSTNVKENYKKITILVKNFIREFLKNKIETEKALGILRPMYIEYIDKLVNPKIKKEKALSIARSFIGESDLLNCELLNIDSEAINPMIESYNKENSKKVDLIEDDYITAWKITLKKRKLLAKKPIVVFVDSINGNIIGTYL